MHILYLDDSGSAANPNEEYLVLGGLSIYEAQAHHFTQELDKLALTLNSANPYDVEFHASAIFGGRTEPWKSLSKQERIGVIKEVLKILANSYDSARVFACAVRKADYPGRDPMEMAFEDLCSRFDMFLKRLQASGDRQRGLIILDESSYETSLLKLARNFRVMGTRFGVIRNLADTPVFIDSKASRLVQLADHVAYAVFRRYEAADTSYFDIISSRFDAVDGRLHGLCHNHIQTTPCMCPGCMSRRLTKMRSEPMQVESPPRNGIGE